MAFSGLFGQNEIKTRLAENVVNGHVGHAYLFNAPAGGGKRSFANEFAKMCTCLAPAEDGSCCGRCSACMLSVSGTNPDIIRIKAEDDKKSVGVDQIREELEAAAFKAPVFSKKKIFIIEGAEKMNEQAQNALLKTLEEPPEYVSIFLLCGNISNMLDTIKSRVVRVDLKRNTDDEILEAVGDVKGVDKNLLCAYSDGIIGRAVEFVENEDNQNLRKQLIKLMLPLFQGSVDARNEIIKLTDLKTKKNDFFFFQFMSFLRDAMVMARLGSKTKIMNRDFRNELTELYQEVGYYKLKAAVGAAQECYKKLSLNALAELAVYDMLLKISG